MSSFALKPSATALVVVDVQDRLAAAMPESERDTMIRNVSVLLEAARRLEIPVIVTEQYPKGLGPTVAPIRTKLNELSPSPSVIEKIDFDACGNEAFNEAFNARGRGAVVLTGMEAHICVWQTARSLVARGAHVHVPFDAICSRMPDNRRIAEDLLREAGAVVTTTETVLFDLLGRGEGEHFKAISKMLK